MTRGRSQFLTTGNFRDWHALVRQVQRRLVLETSVDHQNKLDYYAPAPVGEEGALGGDRRLSVRLSDVVYISSNSKTKRPRKTKLCTGVSQVTCDSHTDFKVKRSKVKVGRGHVVAAT